MKKKIKKRLKRYLDKKQNAAIQEIIYMTPVFIVGSAAVILIGIIYAFFDNGFDWRFITGLVLGDCVSLLNFYLIGVTAQKTIHQKQEKQARYLANLSYGLRYIGIFSVFAVFLMLDWVNLFAAAAPLFFPRIYYFIYAIRTNNHANIEDNK